LFIQNSVCLYHMLEANATGCGERRSDACQPQNRNFSG
jgi:hypothetical protein